MSAEVERIRAALEALDDACHVEEFYDSTHELVDMLEGELAEACNPAAMTAVMQHIDAQTAEIERLRADAERYRWLRSEHVRHDPICHLSWKQNHDRNGHEWVNTANLDSSIDAAMKETP